MSIRGIRKPIKGNTMIGRIGSGYGAAQELPIPEIAKLLRVFGGGSIGSVSSVALAAPVEFTVTGSPVTNSGTLTFSKATQTANKVWAGPATGAAAQPTFRSLVAADIPAGLGYVVGPASAVTNSVPTYDGTTGKLIQDRGNVFIDSSGRLLVGNATSQTVAGLTGQGQVLGTTADTTAFTLARFSANINSPVLAFAKSRGATVGAHTIVADGDVIGAFSFNASNGTTFNSPALIQAQIEGTPGAAADMPCRINFWTAPDGSATVVNRLDIHANGRVSVGTALGADLGSGTLQVGTTSDSTNAAGVLIGGDTQLFRQAANVLEIPDQVTITTAAFSTPSNTKSGITLGAAGDNPFMIYVDSTQSANNRMSAVQWSGGSIAYSMISDGFGALKTYMKATGGSTSGLSLLTFPDAVANVFGHTAANANAGTLQVKAGTQTTNIAGVGGTLYVNTTQTGNAAGAETNAFSHSIAANTLTTNGASLEFYAAGTFATSASVDKRVKVVYGGTTLFDTGALAVTVAADWSLRGSIIRTGAATQKAVVTFESSDAALRASTDYTTPAETLSGAVTMKLTVNGTNASDTVAEFYKETWAAAA